MTSSIQSQYFNSKTSQQQPPPPQQQQPGYLRRMWDGTKCAVGNTLYGATRPLAWAFNPIGDGVGSGLISGAKREFEQLVQPNSTIVSQLQESVVQALLKQPSNELLQLRELLKKALNKTDSLTNDEVYCIALHLNQLVDNEAKILKDLADLTPDEIQLFRNTAAMFK